MSFYFKILFYLNQIFINLGRVNSLIINLIKSNWKLILKIQTKFFKSKIKSGLFRRTYINNSLIQNPDLDLRLFLFLLILTVKESYTKVHIALTILK